MTDSRDAANGNRFCQVVDLDTLDYPKSLEKQRHFVEQRKKETTTDTLLLVEHPHVITLGRGGQPAHLLATRQLLDQKGVAFFDADRGGGITYHGPGQLVAYPILDLGCWHKDIHRYLRALEESLLRLLAEYGIPGHAVPGAAGVWVNSEKIAAIGVRTSQWVTSHGLALNVNTNLDYFSLIVPCGLANRAVTSMSKLLGRPLSMAEIKQRFCHHFGEVFDFRMHWCSQE